MGHKHKIMDRPFNPKYGTVSQVLLQLVVASRLQFKMKGSEQCDILTIITRRNKKGKMLT